ncbi:MAG: hypothetical protein BGO98_33940 [Myxococcales bacterium 68-20]|nr:MAG: hypothetical protein BGO98_33940 [Myxococcales bacterium 68-20]
MLHAWCLACLVAVAFILRIGPASARETTTIGDVVVSATLRAPATSGCPSERDLLDSIRRTLERPPNAQGPAAVDLVVDVRSGTAVGTVRTTGRGADPSRGERTTRAPSCAHLAEALVLIVVQTLNPVTEDVGEAGAASPEDVEGRGASDVEPERSPVESGKPAESTQSSGASGGTPRPSIEPQPRPLPRADETRFIFGATAGATLASGIFPTAAFGAHFGVWAGLARRSGGRTELQGSRRLELWSTVLLPSALDIQQGVVRFRGLREQVAACPTSFGNAGGIDVSPCVSLGALWVEANGRGFAENTSTVSLVPFVGLAAVSRLRLTDSLGLRLSAEGSVHLRRTQWALLPVGVVHRLAPVTLSLTLAFESLRP